MTAHHLEIDDALDELGFGPANLEPVEPQQRLQALLDRQQLQLFDACALLRVSHPYPSRVCVSNTCPLRCRPWTPPTHN